MHDTVKTECIGKIRCFSVIIDVTDEDTVVNTALKCNRKSLHNFTHTNISIIQSVKEH